MSSKLLSDVCYLASTVHIIRLLEMACQNAQVAQSGECLQGEGWVRLIGWLAPLVFGGLFARARTGCL